MLEKLNNCQKKLFIFLSIISFLLFFLTNTKVSLQIQIYILFVLVSIMGIPHGFFDFFIGKKIFFKYTNKWLLLFIFLYLLISIIYLLYWIYFPKFSLIFFLLIALFHFGFEDYNYMRKGKIVYMNMNIIIKGTIIVFTPILFHNDQVSILFNILIDSFIPSIELSFIQKLLFSTISMVYILFEKDKSYLTKIEGLICFFNFVFLPPLISFTLYFCFLHSIKHFFESIYMSSYVPEDINIKNFL